MTPQKGLYQLVLSMQIHFTHDVVGGVSDAALSRMTLALETTLLPALDEQPALSFREERSLLYRSATSPPLDQLRRWASDLVMRNAHSLTLFAKMQPLTNSALLARLKQGNETEQRHAALLLGQRGERNAIPSLLALLKGDENPRIKAVIGSLVRLKAKEAVIPMIRLAPRASSVFLQQLVSALAELGGLHAEGFLDLISVAHQNQEIRQTAKEAFLELRQRDHGLPQDASLSKHLKEKRESR
jgi:HEAT repeat protein